MKVPEVLLNGVHADITAWRRREALQITRDRRPELLQSAPLSDEDRETLRKLDLAEKFLAELNARGVHAHRMEMFAEQNHPKAWFAAFVPEEKRKAAKKMCFSGRRHVGYLYQAFSMGYAPCEVVQALPDGLCGPATLYLNREGLGFDVENCAAIGTLPDCAVLSAADLSWTACSGKGEVYFARAGK